MIIPKMILNITSPYFLAGTPGFEPRQAGLKAAVLPLHHTPIDTYII